MADTTDLEQLVRAIDQELHRIELRTAHFAFRFSQDPADDCLPYAFDYLESLGCKVVNVWTLPRADGTLYHELTIRRPVTVRPWDGSI